MDLIKSKYIILGLNANTNTISKMPASQQNGHDFDNEIKNIYNVHDVSYTSPHDIPEEFNDGIPASVKSSVGDTCDCGDALRMFNNSKLDKYQMIRGRFEQVGGQKHLREVHLIDLSKSTEILWGTITHDDVVALSELTKTYRPGNEDVRKAVHSMKDELNKKSGLMQFRPKMDSQQRRLQCSIPKWTDFVRLNPTRVLEHTTTGLFRGTQLTLIKESLRRIRKARS
jgi:hypothetical protein